MFVLRSVSPELTHNTSLGESYSYFSFAKNPEVVKQYCEDKDIELRYHDEILGLVVGESGDVIAIHNWPTYTYFIMTEGGKTFERLF